MIVLVINCGSSSLKYQLFNMSNEEVLAKGLVERIGMEGALLTHQPSGAEKVKLSDNIPDHQKAIEMVLAALTNEGHGVVSNIKEIQAVGHRVVHGGEKFASSVVITEGVLKGIEEVSELAPLHNPPNIIGIKACQNLMAGVPQVAVFDTAFHQTMPSVSYLYGIPYELYEKYGIRRYGFHGTSHKFVAQRAAALMNRPLESLKLITCHLGNGASITAINGGNSIATSMGFTPLEGLVMGTRSGDIDPAIVSFIMEKEKMTAEEVNDLLNKKSGVLGLSGISSDFRDLEDAAAQGNERAQIALDAFVYDVKKYIGAYTAILNGIDGIIFTAGLGENSAYIRERVCSNLDYLGINIDSEANNIRGIEKDVATEDSKVRVLVVPTNEELMIGRDTLKLVHG